MGVSTKYLLATAFLTGTILMVLEMVGSRILSPYFGNSIYVWGNLIGIILLALSIGYFVGGKIADKYSSLKLLYSFIMLASLYILATLFFYVPFLESLSGLSAQVGSSIATFVLFAPPMFLLSIVPPFIIKLFAKTRKVGSAVGSVTGISTIGNIFGIYFSTFIMIPQIGSRLTLNVSFIILFAISIIALIMDNKKSSFAALVPFLLFTVPIQTLDDTILYSDESAYNFITLKQEEGELRLILNKDYQSISNSEYYFSGYYFEYFLLLPELNEVDDLLILGMGGGTSIEQFQFYYPDIKIDAVEIDEKVIQTAKNYFSITDENLNTYAIDARQFLIHNQKKYDAIEIDLFSGSRYIPFYVATIEFFSLVSNSLTSDGVGAMNIISKDQEILNSIEQTLLEVFPSVFRVDVNDANHIVFFHKKNINIDDFKNKLISSDIDLNNISEIINPIRIEKNPQIQIFTDDKAPIEYLTNRDLV